jgi:hypothetical protein
MREKQIPIESKVLRFHTKVCRDGCKALALQYLSRYLPKSYLNDIYDACIRTEVPFPYQYCSNWYEKGFIPNIVGIIQVQFKDTPKIFTYPMEVIEVDG